MHKVLRSKTGKIKLQTAASPGRLALCVLAIVAAFALGTALAQEPKAPEKAATPPAISPSKEASIRKMLELTGAKQHAIDFGQEVSEQMNNMWQKNLPPSKKTEEFGNSIVGQITKSLGSEEFVAKLIPVYAKAFSEEEINSINKFYETPAGQKLLDVSPTVREEASEVTENWIKGLLPDIRAKILKEFPELNPDNDKK